MIIEEVYVYNLNLMDQRVPEGRLYYRSNFLKSSDYNKYANALRNGQALAPDEVKFSVKVIMDEDLSIIHSRILESHEVDVEIYPDQSRFYLRIKGSSKRVPEKISRLVEKYLLDYMSTMELFIINGVTDPKVYRFNRGVLEVIGKNLSPREVLKYSRIGELIISEYDDLIYLHQDIYFRSLVFNKVSMGDEVNLDYYHPEVKSLIVRSDSFLNLRVLQPLVSLEIYDHSCVTVVSSTDIKRLEVTDGEVFLLGDNNKISHLELNSRSELLGVKGMKVKHLVLSSFEMYDRMPTFECTDISLDSMIIDNKVLNRMTTENLSIRDCDICVGISEVLGLPSESLEIINSKDHNIINEIIGEVHPRLELSMSYYYNTNNDILIKNSEFDSLYLSGIKDSLIDLYLSNVESSVVNIINLSTKIDHVTSNEVSITRTEDINHDDHISDSVINNLQVLAFNCALSITNCIIGIMSSPTISEFTHSRVDKLTVSNDDSTLSMINSKIGTLKVIGDHVDFVVKRDSEISLMIIDCHRMATTYDDNPFSPDRIKVNRLHLILNWYISSYNKNFGYMKILDSLLVTNELVLYIHEGIRHIYEYRKFSEFITPDCLIITSRSTYNLLMKKHVINSDTKVRIVSNNELKKTLGI
jgi:hypothetical protein